MRFTLYFNLSKTAHAGEFVDRFEPRIMAATAKVIGEFSYLRDGKLSVAVTDSRSEYRRLCRDGGISIFLAHSAGAAPEPSNPRGKYKSDAVVKGDSIKFTSLLSKFRANLREQIQLYLKEKR